jgi:hypothetical protein
VIRDFPLAAAPTLADRANRWLSQPSPGPAPRLAATVMFVRDGSAGPEVFMLRRVATMALSSSPGLVRTRSSATSAAPTGTSGVASS